MNKSFSIYLDLVRFIAACLVVIYHSNMRNIVTDVLPFSTYGHDAVIVFFVLSGFVISYVTDIKENTPQLYWASRLSRIYSLAIPAIILTPFLDMLGESFSDAFYVGKTTYDYALLRIFTSIFFINEIWGISIMSFSNVPYWSVCYEMWYYILFSMYMFLSGWKRNVLIFFTISFLGPKIILLAPIWITGVVIFRWRRLAEISVLSAMICIGISLIGLYFYYYFNVSAVCEDFLKNMIGKHLHKQLTFSKFFIGDYVLTLVIFLNFVGARKLLPYIEEQMVFLERPIKFLASYTFTLYIFHQPLILFYAAILDKNPDGYLFYTLVMGLMIGTVFLIGFLIEHRRYLFKKLLYKYVFS